MNVVDDERLCAVSVGPVTPLVILPLPSGKGVTGSVMSFANEKRPKIWSLDEKR